ncbi:hypothetical protein LT337_15635 [Mycolicibacterium fortuitum]|nr:hypothetical protein LT337_15635 [Mycolicibacterium fortuitum]
MTRKVIFPDPDIWTRKEPMTHQPAAVNRRLTDDERHLLTQLTIWVIAEQTGVTDDEAAQVLDDINRDIGLHMQGDNIDVQVITGNGHVLLHCTREWIAYWAHTDAEELTIDELRRSLSYYRGDNR